MFKSMFTYLHVVHTISEVFVHQCLCSSELLQVLACIYNNIHAIKAEMMNWYPHTAVDSPRIS